jgi:UPF0271 protein
MMKQIDLNLDAGESIEALRDGSEEALYQIVSSVNIACGGHAGDSTSMSESVHLAQKYNLAIGAHPSYPDRENFGRRTLSLSKSDLTNSLVEQIQSLAMVCAKVGANLSHVKAHGALYNDSAQDLNLAECILHAVRAINEQLIVVTLADSPFFEFAKRNGFKVRGEAFVDRSYESNGRLRARSLVGAMIEDPTQAAKQALAIADHRALKAYDGTTLKVNADTLCIHGDSPNALAVARVVRETLSKSGFEIRALI